MQTTRSSLLSRVRNLQDQESWTEFVEIYGVFLERVLRRLQIPPDDALDLVQETFQTVVNHIGDFEYDRSKRFRGWLATIAFRKASRFFEKKKRLLGPAGGTVNLGAIHGAAGELLDEQWYAERVRIAADRTKAKVGRTEWEVFRRTVLEPGENQAAAEALNIDVGYLYVCKARAKKVFLQALEETDE